MVSTHSRPKAAAIWSMAREWGYTVSTHSRPKAAAASTVNVLCELTMFQHTAARRRLHNFEKFIYIIKLFQHTAARRRLLRLVKRQKAFITFQHTAARRRLPSSSLLTVPFKLSFNTQPPEGGCLYLVLLWLYLSLFQHTAARRRLRASTVFAKTRLGVSTHSRPKAAASASGPSSWSAFGFNTQPPEGGCKNTTE